MEKNIEKLNSFPVNNFRNINFLNLIRKDIKKRAYKIIVLDDDPTGVQTVHDVIVITEWSKKSLNNLFESENDIFYILTNSRSMSEKKTGTIHKKIAENISEISKKTRKDFIIISRGDSTLRGHYPLETNILKSTFSRNLNINYTHVIIIPAFFEGGRYTFNDVHWVKENDSLIPCSKTEFSKDPQFGYKNSNLKEWIEEKTKKNITADNVLSISIKDIREGGPYKIKKILTGNLNKTVIINSIDYKDLEVFTYGCILAEKDGIVPIFRTAASFVKIRGAIEDKEILTSADIFSIKDKIVKGKIKNRIGLVIVGSFVRKSTEQLDLFLKNGKNILPLILNIDKILNGSEDETERITKLAVNALNINKTPIIYTPREFEGQKEGERKVLANTKNINISSVISNYLVTIVKKIIAGSKIKIDYILTKGGITSSEIITKTLGIREALVLGQLYPGIPVLKVFIPEKFVNLAIIIFPGNVGNQDTLLEIYNKIGNN